MPTPLGRFKRVLFGRPLASDRLEHERLNKRTALAVLSSDAISSVAYATEQTLIVLAVLGAAALNYVVFDLAHAGPEVKPLGAAEIAAERAHAMDGAAVREHRKSLAAAGS